MKQSKVTKAYQSLATLATYKLPVKKAYAIYSMMKELEGPCSFVVQEEMKYADEYGGTVMDNGMVHFETNEKAAIYRAKVQEISDMDVDIKIKPVTLTEADLGGAGVAPADIYALEGFVTFK